MRGGKRPTVAPRKFDTGAGKGTGDGPVLCVPRLETGAKSGSPCHNCLQGRFGLMADMYPNWFRPYKAIEVSGSRWSRSSAHGQQAWGAVSPRRR